MIGSLVSYCVSGLSQQDQLDEIEKFFESKAVKGFDRSLQQAKDSVKAKIQWQARDTDDLRQWLEMLR